MGLITQTIIKCERCTNYAERDGVNEHWMPDGWTKLSIISEGSEDLITARKAAGHSDILYICSVCLSDFIIFIKRIV